MIARISWRHLEATFPAVSPDPEALEPLGFPPPPPGRPWIYANVIASRNGIVTWLRTEPDDDPVRAIAGGDFSRAGRRADLHLMRQLRASADAVAFGAQTLRDQPDLVGAADDVDGPLGESLRRFRADHGRPRLPLQVIYSASGRLDLDLPIFREPGATVVVVTTGAGALRLRAGGSDARRVAILAAGDETVTPAGLVDVHRRLFAERGVRYVDCEGGMVVIDSLREAGLLDELFVTVTDVDVDVAAHDGVRRLFPVEGGGGRRAAAGRTAADPGYVFRRWRFSRA